MKTILKTFLELIRIKQSIGSLLLIIPCFLAIALIYKTNPDIAFNKFIFTAILFSVGAFLMRSAGCIINDLLDKNFDKKVARTKNRPLASEKISSKKAVFFLIILLFLGLIILLQFNYQTIVGGFVALGLIITYPLMKRITYFPQIFLGITFNFGIIMAGLALNSSICNGFKPMSFTIESVSSPSVGAFRRCCPGVNDSLGTTPGMVNSLPSLNWICCSISLAA